MKYLFENTSLALSTEKGRSEKKISPLLLSMVPVSIGNSFVPVS